MGTPLGCSAQPGDRMTWMKVDDRLHAHRKARVAGLPAMGLWVLTGSWVADTLSDGFIPAGQPYAWGGPDTPELADRLVDAGLWLPTEHLGEKGWMFHDWQDFQPTKADVMAQRVMWREKKRRSRSMCPEGTPSGSPGTGSSSSKENPYPDTTRESPRDKSTHVYVAARDGTCAECRLPQTNRRHR